MGVFDLIKSIEEQKENLPSGFQLNYQELDNVLTNVISMDSYIEFYLGNETSYRVSVIDRKVILEIFDGDDYALNDLLRKFRKRGWEFWYQSDDLYRYKFNDKWIVDLVVHKS